MMTRYLMICHGVKFTILRLHPAGLQSADLLLVPLEHQSAGPSAVSVRLSDCLSVYLLCPSVCLSDCLSVYLPAALSACLVFPGREVEISGVVANTVLYSVQLYACAALPVWLCSHKVGAHMCIGCREYMSP